VGPPRPDAGLTGSVRRSGSATRISLTDGTELPLTTRTEDPVTLGTTPRAGTTGSHGWYL
jgi:hypothetical protein